MAHNNNKENNEKSFLNNIVSYTSAACATSHSKSITNYQKRKANRSSIAFYQHLKKSNKTKTLKSIRSKQQQQQQMELKQLPSQQIDAALSEIKADLKLNQTEANASTTQNTNFNTTRYIIARINKNS